MKLTSHSIRDGKPIPEQFAFGKPHPNDRMALAANRSPHLAWEEAPEDTKSFVVLCVDPDVPSEADDVNQEGKKIPADLARVDFYHWVMVDVPPDVTELDAGSCSDGVTPGGKQDPPGPEGTRQGLNDYTSFMKGTEAEGRYFGYDGPCPPWNDTILHHYHFRVLALDVDRCPVEGEFTGPDVVKAVEGHVLDEASIMGTYTLNPRVSG